LIFRNAALNSLLRIPFELVHDRLIQLEESGNFDDCHIIKILCDLIRCFKNKNVYEKEIVKTIYNLKRQIGRIFEKYNRYSQEDSVDFYKNFLNCLLEEFKSSVKFAKEDNQFIETEFRLDYQNKEYYIQRLKETITNYKNEFYTPENFMSNLYEGVFVNEYLCTICGKSSCSLERFIDITLQTVSDDYSNKEINLVNSLELFFGEQYFGEEGIPCSECNQLGIFYGNKYIACLPRIISITLDRADIFNNRKDNRKIKQVLELDLSKFLIFQENGKFELFSSIIHFGGLNSGHYIRYIFFKFV